MAHKRAGMTGLAPGTGAVSVSVTPGAAAKLYSGHHEGQVARERPLVNSDRSLLGRDGSFGRTFIGGLETEIDGQTKDARRGRDRQRLIAAAKRRAT
jgi:hypothetical protein